MIDVEQHTAHSTQTERAKCIHTLSEILYSAQYKVCIIVSSDLEIVIDRLNGYDVCRLCPCTSQLTESNVVCVCTTPRMVSTKLYTYRGDWATEMERIWKKKKTAHTTVYVWKLRWFFSAYAFESPLLSHLIVWFEPFFFLLLSLIVKCAHENKTLTVIKRLFALPFENIFVSIVRTNRSLL